MINNVTLAGRLTDTPDIKTTQSGVPVLSFCIAVDRRIQPKDGAKQADFIQCVAWRNAAEFIKRYFSKGDPIALIGEIQTRKYKDKDGNNRTAVEVVVNQASFCGRKNNATDTPTPYSTDAAAGFEVLDNDADLPF